jgi:hypothetical protein
LSAWCELIAREEMRRDADKLQLARVVRTSKPQDFKKLVKQLSEKGG